MTEESFQQCRKLMRKINHLRGEITSAKGHISKWTAIEDSHRRNLKEDLANSAKRQTEKAIVRLEKLKKQLAEINFPYSNIPNPKPENKCNRCGKRIKIGNELCAECDSVTRKY